jgi:hypothetical protein
LSPELVAFNFRESGYSNHAAAIGGGLNRVKPKTGGTRHDGGAPRGPTVRINRKIYE